MKNTTNITILVLGFAAAIATATGAGGLLSQAEAQGAGKTGAGITMHAAEQIAQDAAAARDGAAPAHQVRMIVRPNAGSLDCDEATWPNIPAKCLTRAGPDSSVSLLQ